MCLSLKHVEYLERTNETDFQSGKISYETYVRFADIVDRCRECELCGNAEYGDIQSECRLHFLRVFVSMKRDTEKLFAERRQGAQAAAPVIAPIAVAPAPVIAPIIPASVNAPVIAPIAMDPAVLAPGVSVRSAEAPAAPAVEGASSQKRFA